MDQKAQIGHPHSQQTIVIHEDKGTKNELDNSLLLTTLNLAFISSERHNVF